MGTKAKVGEESGFGDVQIASGEPQAACGSGRERERGMDYVWSSSSSSSSNGLNHIDCVLVIN